MGWTFTAVTIAWVFFRAANVRQAFEYLSETLHGINSWPEGSKFTILSNVTLLFLGDYFFKESPRQPLSLPTLARYALYAWLTYEVASQFGSNKQFIYFAF